MSYCKCCATKKCAWGKRKNLLWHKRTSLILYLSHINSPYKVQVNAFGGLNAISEFSTLWTEYFETKIKFWQDLKYTLIVCIWCFLVWKCHNALFVYLNINIYTVFVYLNINIYTIKMINLINWSRFLRYWGLEKI